MANNRIRLFQTTQKCFKAVGFYASPSQPNENCQFNWKNLYHLFAAVIMIVTVLGFLIFKAQTVYEYGITFYITISFSGLIIHYACIVCKMGKILKLIEVYEEFIERRKCENLTLELKFLFSL